MGDSEVGTWSDSVSRECEVMEKEKSGPWWSVEWAREVDGVGDSEDWTGSDSSASLSVRLGLAEADGPEKEK